MGTVNRAIIISIDLTLNIVYFVAMAMEFSVLTDEDNKITMCFGEKDVIQHFVFLKHRTLVRISSKQETSTPVARSICH